MTSRTSLIISGSSAEVGSSKSMTLGSMASDRAMATRCCWPPESWAGNFWAWWATPTRSSSSIARFSASALGTLRALIGPSVTLSRIVLWANRLNDWKTMPTSARSWASSLPSSGRGLPSMVIDAGLEGLEPVDGAAQRRLAGPRGADDDDDLALADGQVDVLQDVQLAEVLVDALEYDQWLRHVRQPTGWSAPLACICRAMSPNGNTSSLTGPEPNARQVGLRLMADGRVSG